VVIDMIEMETFESGLWDILGLFFVELGSKLSEIGFTEERVVEVVAFEDIIEVVGLHLVGTDGEIFESDVRPGTSGNGLRADGKSDYQE
jgi:hypothetical protein